jgi:hypothetical protein
VVTGVSEEHARSIFKNKGDSEEGSSMFLWKLRMRGDQEGRGRCLASEILSQTLNQEIRLNVGNLYQTAFWPQTQTHDLASTKMTHPIYYTITFQVKKRSYEKDRKK